MTRTNSTAKRARGTASRLVAVVSLTALGIAGTSLTAQAAASQINLGTAAGYSVLGGVAVSNTGPSTLDADLGVSPGSSISGFPPGIFGGALHAADAAADQAQSDLVTGYNDAAGRAPDASVSGDLVGLTLTAGTYKSDDTLDVTGTLTLDAQDDTDAVFIFQVASALTTGSASRISLLNGAQACNVYWQVGESATLGTGSEFVGTVMALTSITVTTGTTVDGRMLARNGAVTLDTNTFIHSPCTVGEGGGGTVTSTTSSTSTPTSTESTITGSPTETSTATETSTTPTDTTPATTDSTTPTQTTTTAVRGEASPPTTDDTTLAYTGANSRTVPLLVAGSGLLVLGGGLMLMTRRRNSLH